VAAFGRAKARPDAGAGLAGSYFSAGKAGPSLASRRRSEKSQSCPSRYFTGGCMSDNFASISSKTSDRSCSFPAYTSGVPQRVYNLSFFVFLDLNAEMTVGIMDKPWGLGAQP
jgi:hypothetical protein